MRTECIELLNLVGEIQNPQVQLSENHPEGLFFESFDASNNSYPEDISQNSLSSIEEFEREWHDWMTKKPWDIEKKRKYLWVFTDNAIRILLEATPNELAERKCICHTNITGYQHARLGGELWFVKNGERIVVYFNFKSKRYPATEIERPKELVKNLFLCVGYNAAVFIEDEFRL